MLMQRILTAAVLIPALLALVWYAPTQWLYVALSVVGLLMAWEWTALLGWTRQPLRRRLYLIATAALLAATWVGLTQYAVLFYGLLPVALIWLLLPLYLRGYPHAATPPAALLAPAGLLMIASTLVAIAALHAHPNGALKLLFVFFLVFAADTGAYFAGRRFGKRKLAPAISPGKSVEGALGGLVAVAIWAATAGVWAFGLRTPLSIATLVLLCVVVGVVSIVGDLTESMLKRNAGVKDSGQILPGHGGILDRVDSIVAAVPVMVVGLHLAGIH